jgi:tetratricopeptide (TPR) repeat protein
VEFASLEHLLELRRRAIECGRVAMRVGIPWAVGLLVAATWAGGLRAAMWWQGRQHVSSNDEATESTEQHEQWAKAMAAIPQLAAPAVTKTNAELVGARGVIALFRAERLTELEDVLERAQGAFEADPKKEHVIQNLLHGFRFVGPDDHPKLDAWAAASPRSFGPPVARAISRIWRTNDDSSCNPKGRQHELELARKDLEHALSLRPALIVAYEELLRIENIEHGTHASALYGRAVAICPACVGPRAQYLASMKSGKRASRDAMRDFALEAQAHVSENPRLRSLVGYIDNEECAWLSEARQFTEALGACNRAIAEYPDALFFAEKARVLNHLERHEEAVLASTQALAENPADIVALLSRATAHAGLESWRAARDDATLALQLAPQNERAKTLLLWLIDRLEKEARDQLRSGELRDAITAYDVLLEIMPSDAGLLARRAAVRARLGLPAADGAP